ncbi:MAG: sulfite exporter TauE/SafE family protein [Chloroflexi bacterium]|nr:sulfite exporter TauE/SafE family protein [Chloroflexota bacterium]
MSPEQLGEVVPLVLIGLSAGFLAGLLGIGGGVLMVPAMVLLLGFDQHVAQGTSLLVIIPAALTGSFTHHRKGRLVLREAALVAAGGVIGAVLGSVFALSIDDELLQRLFAGFLLIVAARILLPKGLFGRDRAQRSPAADPDAGSP